MITVTLTRRGREITAIAAEGHAGLAESGNDILCAAVSAAVQLVECQLSDILKIPLYTEIDEERAYISLSLTRGIDREAAQPPFHALAITARRWTLEYPGNITIQEVTSK